MHATPARLNRMHGALNNNQGDTVRSRRSSKTSVRREIPLLFAQVGGLSRSRRLAPALLGAIVLLASPGVAQSATATEPKGLETMRAVALQLLRIQDYERSIAVYREILKHTPDDSRSHYDLAAALSFIRRYEEAAPPIRTAIRLNPDDLKAQEMASLIFLNLRWYEEAFEATLNAARLGEPTAMFSLVNMYEKGIGVTANPDRALHWAVQAAEHGHLGAMALMEQVHRSGRLGQTVDNAAADAWKKRLRDAKNIE